MKYQLDDEKVLKMGKKERSDHCCCFEKKNYCDYLSMKMKQMEDHKTRHFYLLKSLRENDMHEWRLVETKST